MPTDPAQRDLIRAVDRLTTQVGRIADTLTPSVVTDDDGGQTTGDDGPVHQAADGTSWAQRMTVPDFQVVTETMRENDRLRTELARIRRALDPDDETYIREAVDDQLALTATIGRVRTALDDRPALCTDSVYERGWNDAAEMVRNALTRPTK